MTKKKTVADYPHLVAEWSEKNTKKPSDYTYGSNKKVWWQCSKNPKHEWEAVINNRTNPTSPRGCPYCRGTYVLPEESLGALYPELAKEWHPKNRKSSFEYVKGSGQKVWWRCSVNPKHEWKATIDNRSRFNKGCPYCSGRKCLPEESFGALYPDLVNEWHPTKNKKRPTEYTKAANQKVWWRCAKNSKHEWLSRIAGRTNPTSPRGCPYCSKHKFLPEESLAAKYPELVKEWHSKNKKSPFEYARASGKKVWWQCSKNSQHEWEASISNRTKHINPRGCPFCVVGKYGVRGMTKDGHLYHSKQEGFIDDWLFEHNIPHSVKIKYPFHPVLNLNNKKDTDWVINGVFVEYFGLLGKFNYDKGTDEKIKLCRLNKIELIAIYPFDLNKLDEIFSRFLS